MRLLKHDGHIFFHEFKKTFIQSGIQDLDQHLAVNNRQQLTIFVKSSILHGCVGPEYVLLSLQDGTSALSSKLG